MSEVQASYHVHVLPELERWKTLWARYYWLRARHETNLRIIMDDSVSDRAAERAARAAERYEQQLGEMDHQLAIAEAIVAVAEAVQTLAQGDPQTAHVLAGAVVALSRPS